MSDSQRRVFTSTQQKGGKPVWVGIATKSEAVRVAEALRVKAQAQPSTPAGSRYAKNLYQAAETIASEFEIEDA